MRRPGASVRQAGETERVDKGRRTMSPAVVDISVACGGEQHRLTMRVDRRGHARWVVHAHDQDAERVLASLGAQVPRCMAVPGLVRGLARLGIGAEERARWVEAGVVNHNEVSRWRVVGGPDVVTRWRAVGASTPEEAHYWFAMGTTLEAAERWAGAGVALGSEVVGWRALGVSGPDGARRWLEAGVASGVDAGAWARAGVAGTDEVRTWLEAGSLSGGDMAGWVRAGAGAADIAAWHDAGVGSSAEALSWMAAGAVGPAEVAAWRASGVSEASQLSGWSVVGVAEPSQRQRWVELGITAGAVAAEWVHPVFVYGFEEIAAWIRAGVTNARIARARSGSGYVPAAVAKAREADRRRLQSGRSPMDGRPQVVAPVGPGSDRHVEVHFYLWGRPSSRDHASHWTAADVAGDHEVPGSRRSGIMTGDAGAEPWLLSSEPAPPNLRPSRRPLRRATGGSSRDDINFDPSDRRSLRGSTPCGPPASTEPFDVISAAYHRYAPLDGCRSEACHDTSN